MANVVDLSRVRAAHKRVIRETNRAVAATAASAGEHAVQHVHQHPGFKPRTGHLQDSTQWRTVYRNGRLLRIQNRAKYAGPIDKGSPPHVIRARRRRALRFVSGGAVMFRQAVNHPGNRPFHFLRNAAESAGKRWQRELDGKMHGIARVFNSSR